MTGVIWLSGLPARPLCDVPWHGNTVVFSDGSVHMCCFSNATVGSVHEQSFEEIWNGQKMQAIRASLRDGVLPPECRSPSCPFFRGDTQHYLVQRRAGRDYGGGADEGDLRAGLGGRLDGSAIAIEPRRPRAGERIAVRFDLVFSGAAFSADAFVAVRMPGGEVRFLPEHVDFPLPFAMGAMFDRSRSYQLYDAVAGVELPVGLLDVCLALFAPGSDPNVERNCYWATVESFEIRNAGDD